MSSWPRRRNTRESARSWTRHSPSWLASKLTTRAKSPSAFHRLLAQSALYSIFFGAHVSPSRPSSEGVPNYATRFCVDNTSGSPGQNPCIFMPSLLLQLRPPMLPFSAIRQSAWEAQMFLLTFCIKKNKSPPTLDRTKKQFVPRWRLISCFSGL